jgi:hypothetical protein
MPPRLKKMWGKDEADDEPRKKTMRRSPVRQDMREDEARARIQLGLYRIARRNGNPGEPLGLFTGKELARELCIPERHLGLVREVSTTTVHVDNVHPLSGGLWRVDFNGFRHHEDRQMAGVAEGWPDATPYHIQREPRDLSGADVACGTFAEPEVERPTGWERIVRDEE